MNEHVISALDRISKSNTHVHAQAYMCSSTTWSSRLHLKNADVVETFCLRRAKVVTERQKRRRLRRV